jgi:hypothetical protein
MAERPTAPSPVGGATVGAALAFAPDAVATVALPFFNGLIDYREHGAENGEFPHRLASPAFREGTDALRLPPAPAAATIVSGELDREQSAGKLVKQIADRRCAWGSVGAGAHASGRHGNSRMDDKTFDWLIATLASTPRRRKTSADQWRSLRTGA